MLIDLISIFRFLHASLQLDALQDCYTAHDAMRILEAFPSKIEDVYHQTWNRIVGSGSSRQAYLAKTAFLWVLYARESLHVEVLQMALATCPETYHFDSARLPSESTILSTCRGLLTIDKESQLVRLVRKSFRMEVTSTY